MIDMTAKNTPSEWQKLLRNFSDKEYKIEVSAESVEEDVVSLRYFLPLAFYLKEQEKISEERKLELSVRTPESWGEERRTALKSRLTAYFPEWKTLPFVDIKVDEKELLSGKWSASRIFPLCGVEAEATDCLGSYWELKELVRETQIGELSGICYNNLSAVADALMVYINDPDGYKGTSEHKIRKEDKKRLSGMVCEYVQGRRSSMTVLAQVVWLYILRELIESKQLLLLFDKEPELQTSILEKSYLDAVSYGEAIYQVVENACLHSDTHRAWFGFRTYCAGKAQSMSSLAGEVQTREMLYRRFVRCFEKAVKKPCTADPEQYTADPRNMFNEDHRIFFEFYVLDHAANETGMEERYNRDLYQKTRELVAALDREKAPPLSESYPTTEQERENWNVAIEWLNKKSRKELPLPVDHFRELFDLETRWKNVEEHIEDVTVHYGLRLLRHIVSVNGGYLMGRSPGGGTTTQFYYNGNQQPERAEESKFSCTTEWSALLPITYAFREDNDSFAEMANGADFLGKTVPAPPGKLIYMDSESIWNGVEGKDKRQAVAALDENLRKWFYAEEKAKKKGAIFLLKVDEQAGERLEWFAKAVFVQIARARARNKVAPLRIAIVFSEPSMIHEFTRLFSIFYLKLSRDRIVNDTKNKQVHDMENTQVALCTKSSLYRDVYRVSLVLTGGSILQARKNAKLFAYHQIGDTLKYLPLISYLTAPERAVEPTESCEIFPFDVFLPQELPERTGIYDICKSRLNMVLKKTWFTERIGRVLETDIREEPMGCMVDNVHVRLSSKVHLERFYEAELLFHDVGNIQRFAYMVVMSLLYGENALTNDKYPL